MPTSFFVRDGIVGSDSMDEAIELQLQLQVLFGWGGFILCKWKASEAKVLQHITTAAGQGVVADEFRCRTLCKSTGSRLEYRLWLLSCHCGRCDLHWHIDQVTTNFQYSKDLWCFGLVFSSHGKGKFLLQRSWEAGLGLNDPVPSEIQSTWTKWREELPVLCNHFVSRCYFPNM